MDNKIIEFKIQSPHTDWHNKCIADTVYLEAGIFSKFYYDIDKEMFYDRYAKETIENFSNYRINKDYYLWIEPTELILEQLHTRNKAIISFVFPNKIELEPIIFYDYCNNVNRYRYLNIYQTGDVIKIFKKIYNDLKILEDEHDIKLW